MYELASSQGHHMVSIHTSLTKFDSFSVNQDDLAKICQVSRGREGKGARRSAPFCLFDRFQQSMQLW